ncbi:MAG: hypothetical protein LUQ34_01895 [Euryarchaeota archaeon]|nr:hypothetical protein [Euryarchaeota archaeon]
MTFTLLAISAPPSEAVPFPSHQSTATNLEIGGIFDQIDSLLSSLDQIDSLLNNFTTDLNSLIPQQTTPPSVNITSVKTVNTGKSSTTPQVIVTVKNGKAVLDGVRIDVVYKNSAGAKALSNSTVLALKAEETRSITFKPQSLPAGSYVVGVTVYKSGTDPSNKASPPYDLKENAATLIIAGAGTAGDEGIQISSVGGILSQLSPWIYFIIVMTGLISVALFFVFWQNKSGEDRFGDDHFKGDDYVAGDSIRNPAALRSASPKADNSSERRIISKPRRSRKIEVTAPDGASEESDTNENPPRST